jgi:hypothetical protein
MLIQSFAVDPACDLFPVIKSIAAKEGAPFLTLSVVVNDLPPSRRAQIVNAVDLSNYMP